MRICSFLCFCGWFNLIACHSGGGAVSTPPLHHEMIPAEAGAAQVQVYDVNAWTEQGQFFVTGICVNESAAWQKLWVDVTPLDASGKPLNLRKAPSVIVPVFSSAVPPKGRTAFFAGWPLSDFSGTPVQCRVKGAGALPVPAGPVLLIENLSGVKMLQPKAPGLPATEEIAWQINATLNNPMPLPAAHPKLELLLYGADERLWLSLLLDPLDPQFRQVVALDPDGPLAGGEKRQVGVYAYYAQMPQALKDHKIGRVELLAFEAR